MSDWVEALWRLSAAARPAVLVTIVRAQGSTPREAGAKMVVTTDDASGSIGGGHLELTALEIARSMLASEEPAGPVLKDFALGPSLGQCCGGATTLMFERVAPPAWRVAVFGAGHVGHALVKLLADLPCRVTWIDSRPDALPAATPENVETVVAEQPADEVSDLAPGTDAVVMTHSHAIDYDVVEALLQRPELGYVGLIGSRTKRERFASRFRERGRDAALLARLTCPIGLPTIPGKLPAEIAIGVVAELLQRRAQRRSLSLSPSRGT